MSFAFISHILISGLIFFVLAAGFKFFLKLKNTIDFSYLGIVIFASYCGALLNIHFGIGIIGTMLISFLASIAFCFLILFLSSKLNNLYFTIGTFALYMLIYQLSLNLEGLTGGALGISGITQNLIGNISIHGIQNYLIFAGILVAMLVAFLLFFKKSFFFKTLIARGEQEYVVKSLGVKVNKYKIVLIILTSLLAVIGGNLYTFYYQFLDPKTFRFGTLMILFIISFLSYKVNDFRTLIIALVVMFFYEYLRFFKVVNPAQIGYVREMLFALFVMISSRIIFRRVRFGREN